MARRAALILAALALIGGGCMLLAYERTLSTIAISEAIDIGQSSLAQTHARFHAPYQIAVGQPPVDGLQIVTPFRRLVLAAEGRARNGGRLLTQREAIQILDANPEQIDVLVEMTFHPLNTFVGVPPYDVTLLPADGAAGAIRPREIERVPRFGARVDGVLLTYPYPLAPQLPAGSQPLLGGTVIAKLNGSLVEQTGVYDVVIGEGEKELARGRVDFRQLR